ncbi:MAG: ABC transporter substrate-binding protein [Spirochaetes bacterium]|nr:ABC transporter substrate-binding protein [Spirochaetota bacterium]
MRTLFFVLAFIVVSSPLFARSEKISFWHGQGFHAKRIIEELVNEYNRSQSDVHVDAVFQGLYQDMEVKMLAAAVTRQLPEVALEQIEYIDLYIKEGLIPPIDAAVKEETRKDVHGVMWDAVTREGKTYGVPFCMSTTVLFYNRDAFKRAGLDPDKPPETWDQIIAAGRRLTVDEDKDGSPDRFAISVWQNGLYGWAPILWANGGTLFSEDGTKIDLTSPAMKTTIGMLKDLVYKYGIMPKSWTDWESGQAFLAGDLAMGFFSSAGIAYSEQNLPWSLGVAPMPSINGRKFTVLTGSALVNFAKNRKKWKAANDFIFWLIEKPNIIRLHKEIGYIPVRKSAAGSLDLRSFHRENPNFRIPVEELAFARALPHHNEYFKINKLLIDMLQQVILQGSSPDETLAATEREINLLLK